MLYFFLLIIHWVSPVCTIAIYIDGCPLEHGPPTRSHIIRENWLSLLQKLSAVNCSSLRSRGSWNPSTLYANNLLAFVQATRVGSINIMDLSCPEETISLESSPVETFSSLSSQWSLSLEEREWCIDVPIVAELSSVPDSLHLLSCCAFMH